MPPGLWGSQTTPVIPGNARKLSSWMQWLEMGIANSRPRRSISPSDSTGSSTLNRPGFADDCQFEDIARGEKQIGPEAYKHDYCRWREAFPDGECKVVNVIAQDNWAVVEYVNRGTHTGTLHSSLGTFEPTGRSVEVRYCSVMRVENGKVVEGRDFYDSATIARQLGVLDV